MGEESGQARAWRKGFARRADTFEDEVLPTARTWRWEAGVTWWRLQEAILAAPLELTETERRCLALYVGRVNQDRLEELSDASAWPGAGWMARRLGVEERTVRRCRQRLEAMGWIVRDYNLANRPNGEHAVDLAPAFARLEELEAQIRALDEDLAAYREAWSSSSLPAQPAPNASPRAYWAQDGAGGAAAPEAAEGDREGGQGCPPKQSHSKGSNPVRERAEVARSEKAGAPPLEPRRSQGAGALSSPHQSAGKARAGPTIAGNAGSNCFPRKAASASAIPPAGSKLAGRVVEELQLAQQASPRLVSMLPATLFADPFSARAVDAGMVARAAEELLPKSKHNRNNGQTALWGWERHGARVVAMLACAIENPTVVDPCRYFGSFCTLKEGTKLDLRVNLIQIIRRQGDGAAQISPADAVAASAGLDPVWAAIVADLRPRIGEGAWGSWFSQVLFRALEDQVLVLTTQTGTAARKIHEAYGGAIRAAGRAAGHPIMRISVTPRGGGDGRR